MLCTNNDVSAHTDICLTGVREGGPMGEVGIFYDVSYGAVDHIAISSWKHGNPSGPDARQYIGVIRNFSGTGSNGSILRCFATWLSGPKLCSAPSDSFYMPEGVPYMFTDLPVVPNFGSERRIQLRRKPQQANSGRQTRHHQVDLGGQLLQFRTGEHDAVVRPEPWLQWPSYV